MSDPIDIPLDGDAPLVDPPIVDHLYLNEDDDRYIITFIPQDRISRREKEMVVIPRDSEDGRRVALRLSELAKILGSPVVRLVHAGAGNFEFSLAGGKQVQLADQSGSSSTSQAVYDQLQDLGMIAQIAFRQNQLLKQKTA
jgi:hypothetical protein